MKKRFSRKAPPKKKVLYGAYDKDGKWWDKKDIQTFTGGMITLCFGTNREDIEITVREE